MANNWGALHFEDSLTGLFNRNKFTMLVNSEPVETAQTEPLGVAYFDLNGLKEVNDRFGHKAGDNFIIRVAKHIKKHFPQQVSREGQNRRIADFGTVVETCSRTRSRSRSRSNL